MAFLMPSYDLGIEAAESFVEEHWPHFFAQALESWTFDAATWPTGRSLAMFKQWFDIELSDFILDLGQYFGAHPVLNDLS